MTRAPRAPGSVTRKSVPITEDGLAAIAQVRRSDSVERRALAELLGVELSANPSEAEILQALMEVGLMAVEQQAMTHGYAALAESQDQEDRAYEQAIRSRRRGGSQD